MGFVIALRVVRIGMIALPDLALELSAGVAWIAIVIPSGYSLLAVGGLPARDRGVADRLLLIRPDLKGPCEVCQLQCAPCLHEQGQALTSLPITSRLSPPKPIARHFEPSAQVAR